MGSRCADKDGLGQVAALQSVLFSPSRESEDTVLLVLKEIYLTQGVCLDQPFQ